ncbi:MAG TPA: alkaline ceramidase [Planctomicrobium sp.]|nr:alkaline ceramidase [Planctomicrobium sp.]
MASPPVVAPPSSFFGLIGLASVDITPPVGIYARNWGAAPHDVATSIHRPLTLNVLTLRESPESLPLILIEADLGFWKEQTLLEQLLSQVMADHQVPRSRILFSLTHTHAGPRMVDAIEEVEGGEFLQDWTVQTQKSARSAVQSAIDSAVPSLLEWHYGSCQLASNRDLVDPDSEHSRRICGYAPGTAADATLLVGRVSSQEGALRALVVNYACHPTTLAFENQALSPDFVGAMREVIQQVCGEQTIPFFLQGASGELAPRHQYVGDPSVADRHGRQLAYAALSTMEDMEPPGTVLRFQGVVESGAPLAIWKPTRYAPETTLQVQELTVELELKDLPTSAEIQAELDACDDRMLTERLRRKLDVRKKLGEGTTFRMPVHGWQIGSAMLIATMSEAYSLMQIELRRQFPENHVICLNITNGWIGYLAPQSLYDEDIYQVWQSPFARGGLERIIEGACGVLQELTTDD